MIKLSIADVINKAAEMKSKNEKIEWLRKNDAVPLRTVLRLVYDTNVEFLIPDTPPPWKKNSLPDTDTMLYREARRLRIFVKGGGYDNLSQVKREFSYTCQRSDQKDTGRGISRSFYISN